MAFNGTISDGACVTPNQAVVSLCPSSQGFTVAQVSTSLPDLQMQYLCKKDAAFSFIGTVPINCEIVPGDLSLIPTAADGAVLGWQVGTVLITVACLMYIKKLLFV